MAAENGDFWMAIFGILSATALSIMARLNFPYLTFALNFCCGSALFE